MDNNSTKTYIYLNDKDNVVFGGKLYHRNDPLFPNKKQVKQALRILNQIEKQINKLTNQINYHEHQATKKSPKKNPKRA